MHNAQTDIMEPKKSYREIFDAQVKEEIGQLRRPTRGLLFSGFSAGLEVGFSVLLMGVLYTLLDGVAPQAIIDIVIANMYAVGFIIVILGRSELFTEHTTLAFLPVLDGRASLQALGRLWACVFSANIAGGAIFALIVTFVGTTLGAVDPRAFGHIGRPLVEHPWWAILSSGVLAGWMMGLVSWLVTASRETISQIVIVWIITTAIGISHLHHSIVGTIEVLAAIFAGQGVTFRDYLHFLTWATLGNAAGGLIFVAVIKYAHARRAG